MTSNSRIINQHINLPPLLRQIPHKAPNLVWRTNIQLKWQDFNPVTHLFLDLLRNLLQCIDPPRRQYQPQILRTCARELNGGGAPNA